MTILHKTDLYFTTLEFKDPLSTDLNTKQIVALIRVFFFYEALAVD